jgi:hypothetical protein
LSKITSSIIVLLLNIFGGFKLIVTNFFFRIMSTLFWFEMYHSVKIKGHAQGQLTCFKLWTKWSACWSIHSHLPYCYFGWTISPYCWGKNMAKGIWRLWNLFLSIINFHFRCLAYNKYFWVFCHSFHNYLNLWKYLQLFILLFSTCPSLSLVLWAITLVRWKHALHFAVVLAGSESVIFLGGSLLFF